MEIIAKDEGISPVYMFRERGLYKTYRLLNDRRGNIEYRVKELRLFVSSLDEEMAVEVSIIRRRWMRRIRKTPGLYWMKDKFGKVVMVNAIRYKHGLVVDVTLGGEEKYISKPRWMSRKEYYRQRVRYKFFAGPVEPPR